jgi:hypothetical protein
MSSKKLMKTKNFFRFWLPPILWAGIIFSFSSLAFVKTKEFLLWDFIAKKSAHLLEYFIFSLLLYRALKNSSDLSQKRSLVFSMLILIIYAISDEFHQSFIPGREPRIRDVAIDSLGGLLGLWLIRFKLAKAPLRLRNWAKNWQLI